MRKVHIIQTQKGGVIQRKQYLTPMHLTTGQLHRNMSLYCPFVTLFDSQQSPFLIPLRPAWLQFFGIMNMHLVVGTCSYPCCIVTACSVKNEENSRSPFYGYKSQMIKTGYITSDYSKLQENEQKNFSHHELHHLSTYHHPIGATSPYIHPFHAAKQCCVPHNQWQCFQ